jgi:hypothetical protein
MKKITLAAYLEQNDSKEIAKAINRAIKTYRHALKDLSHADADINHAKEDCLFAIQGYEQLLEDCHSYLNDWIRGDLDDEEVTLEDVASEDEKKAEQDDSSITFEMEDESDDEEEENTVVEQVEEHLDHAAKDFLKAIEDADDALEGLNQVDGLLFEIIDEAESEGFEISLWDARSYIVAKSQESLSESKSLPPLAKA